MITKRILSHNRPLFLAAILFLAFWQSAVSQEQKHQNGISSTWLILQALPSYSWTSFLRQTNFAFEWEAAPVLYSFGMNKQDPPWHFFQVTQPERFAGSIELVVSTQLYTSKVGTSHWGFSGQCLAHLPLVEYGEYIGLNSICMIKGLITCGCGGFGYTDIGRREIALQCVCPGSLLYLDRSLGSWKGIAA